MIETRSNQYFRFTSPKRGLCFLSAVSTRLDSGRSLGMVKGCKWICKHIVEPQQQESVCVARSIDHLLANLAILLTHDLRRLTATNAAFAKAITVSDQPDAVDVGVHPLKAIDQVDIKIGGFQAQNRAFDLVGRVRHPIVLHAVVPVSQVLQFPAVEQLINLLLDESTGN